MSDDDIRGHIVTLWIVAAILIFVVNMHSLFLSNLTERIDALEQAKTSETQQ